MNLKGSVPPGAIGPKFTEPPFSSWLSLAGYSAGGFVPCFASL